MGCEDTRSFNGGKEEFLYPANLGAAVDGASVIVLAELRGSNFQLTSYDGFAYVDHLPYRLPHPTRNNFLRSLSSRNRMDGVSIDLGIFL